MSENKEQPKGKTSVNLSSKFAKIEGISKNMDSIQQKANSTVAAISNIHVDPILEPTPIVQEISVPQNQVQEVTTNHIEIDTKDVVDKRKQLLENNGSGRGKTASFVKFDSEEIKPFNLSSYKVVNPTSFRVSKDSSDKLKKIKFALDIQQEHLVEFLINLAYDELNPIIKAAMKNK